MSMGSAPAVSRQGEVGRGGAHLAVEVAPALARDRGAAPDASRAEAPRRQARRQGDPVPVPSRGVSPAPAGFTRMSVSTLGHSSTTASMVSAMSPAEVAMMALISAPFGRWVRSCSFSMKVAGTATAPSFSGPAS